jgi:hypothetical protein
MRHPDDTMADISYAGTDGQSRWTGFTISTDELDGAMDAIRERALDLSHATETADKLRGLAETGLQAEFVEKFLTDAGSGVEDLKAWQVGEAIAEVLLETHRGARFPWNMRRDERVPRASLPGADLVGFVVDSDQVYLLFGEVKSSTDADSPPNVLYGKSGMVRQLEGIVDQAKVRKHLIEWLSARCAEGEVAVLFDAALTRWVVSQGADIRIIGCLMRDLEPRSTDLEGRARALGGRLTAPALVELIACYLPIPMPEWIRLVGA